MGTVSNPSISVIVPLFNKERYVLRAINSILTQSFHDFEIVVVNDGSTDCGPEIVRQVHDPRIRLIDQGNAGVSAARNRGIWEAKSGLIGFLDADDEWLPQFLETIVALTQRYPKAGAYATGYLLLKGGDGVCRRMTVKGGRHKCGCYFDLLRGGADVWTSSNIVVRRAVFDEVGAFRVGHKLAEDLDMWFRIGLRYPLACSPRICALYHYYQPDSASHVAAASGVSPLYLSLLELERASDIDPNVRRKALQYLSRQLIKGAEHILQVRAYDVARRRLDLYRAHYGVTMPYLRLRLLTALPRSILKSLIKLRLMLVHYVLAMTSSIRQVYLCRSSGGEGERL